MEQENNSMRERLLARLPQPENSASYREEISLLMAKHEKALFWEKFTARTVMFLGLAVWIIANSSWAKLDANGTITLDSIAGLLYFGGTVNELGFRVSRSKVELLKEMKQVQLQILELQASIQKNPQP
jgi:hypothetical protein